MFRRLNALSNMVISVFLNQGARMARPGVAPRQHVPIVIEGLAPPDASVARGYEAYADGTLAFLEAHEPEVKQAMLPLW